MLTPMRKLTPGEAYERARIRASIDLAERDDADTALDGLIAELIVHRNAVRTVRASWRCLPPHVRNAFNGLPHNPAPTSREYPHD